MNQNVRPGAIAMMAGGLLLLIGVFLPWVDVGPFSESGFSTDGGPGLLGIFCFLIALAVGGVVALKTFAKVNLPDQILGLSWNQIWLMLSFSATLITLGRWIGVDNTGIGLILSVLASIAMLVGSFLELQGEGGSAPRGSAPPTPF